MAAVLRLQRLAGNQAVSALLGVQREVGWKGDDVSHAGKAWNAGVHEVGGVRRIPLDGLPVGLQSDEGAMIPELSQESAKGRAIVLVPLRLNPAAGIEVLVFLHGFTENTGRPYAGYRALDPTMAAKTKKGSKLAQWRTGIDAEDIAPVRDVALDRAEQQLGDSGFGQTVIVLPQGGLRSQFGQSGDRNFDSGAYVGEIVRRLTAEKAWTVRAADSPEAAPKVERVSMSGHSGAGATLANMAMASIEHQKHVKHRHSHSGELTGDLVLFDAINGKGQLETFQTWTLMRLDQDLAALKSAKDEAAQLAYLRTSQKLRGYFSTGGGYRKPYGKLQASIDGWFESHGADLGPMEAHLRANYAILEVAGRHEEVMRGPAGHGSIADALKALHAGAAVAPAAAPGVQKPAAAPAPAPAPAPKSVKAAAVKAVKAAAAPAGAGGDTAKQIAKAILLAKTGGEGQGKTKEAREAAKLAAEQAVAHDILTGVRKKQKAAGQEEAKDTDSAIDTWFAGFEPGATFLGRHIRASSEGEPPGVHHELAVRLAAAEASLLRPGESPLQAGERLQIKDVSGLRRPKTPTGKTAGASMHCFGLAVDIERDNNPFVGNNDKPTKKRPEGGPSIRIIEHATLLLGGALHDPRRDPPSVKGRHGTDSEPDREARAARAAEQWKLLHADSEAVRHYLSMSADDIDAEVGRRLPALTAWMEHPPAGAPPWAEHVTDRTWWRDQHALDVQQQGAGDFGRGRTSDPSKYGFMTLDEELVIALVKAGLSWGGVYATDKDIMHFDLRTGTIGGRPVL